MEHFVIASSPGRVCFAGEDIDWIAGPSILCAVDLRVTVKVTTLPQECEFILLKSKEPFRAEYAIPIANIGDYKKHIMDYVHASVKVFRDQGSDITPFQIEISSQVPVSAGLSSSAAVSVATLAALNKFFARGLSNYTICALACLVESEELKTGAGQMDQYSSGLGGLIYINCETVPPDPIERYELPSNLKVLIADTMKPRSTSEVISWKRRRLSEAEPLIMAYVKHTEAAIERMRCLLKQNDPDVKELATIVSSCHGFLKDYMLVSTDLMDACVETCLKNGALGAKLTGTGMGGCMFALIPDKDAMRAQEALASLPVKTYLTNISHEGLILHKDNA